MGESKPEYIKNKKSPFKGTHSSKRAYKCRVLFFFSQHHDAKENLRQHEHRPSDGFKTGERGSVNDIRHKQDKSDDNQDAEDNGVPGQCLHCDLLVLAIYVPTL